MRTLFYGTLEWGSTSQLRMESLRQFADHLHVLDMRMALGEYMTRSAWTRIKIRTGWPPLARRTGTLLLRECLRYRPDLIWVEQGCSLQRRDLEKIQELTSAFCVHYTPDSVKAPGWRLALRDRLFAAFDLCITTKPCDVDILRGLGARRVMVIHQGYNPLVHRPLPLSGEDAAYYGCDVSFVGQRMWDRARSLRTLIHAVPCSFHLYGRHWERGTTGSLLGPLQHGWVAGDAYAKAICGARINLAFLNHEVGDQCTTRVFEIPACGGFMLSERTEDLLDQFAEDREAVFFGNDEELCDKVRFYLAHDELRQRIARAGYERVVNSGYSWENRMSRCWTTIKECAGARWEVAGQAGAAR